jgi:hypothetical protein
MTAYWTTSALSSIVTDLVLIYESVTSSKNGLRMTSHLRMNCLPTQLRLNLLSSILAVFMVHVS